MMSILQSFPKQLTPREVQTQALLKLEENWNKADVFVLNLPVASGKSAIAETIAAWRGRGSSAILTPTNILLEQYAQNSELKTYFGKDSVDCQDEAWGTCAERYEWSLKKPQCGNRKTTRYCKGCPYSAAERYMFHTKAQFNYITNYFKYVSLINKTVPRGAQKLWLGVKAKRPFLIIDEAHNLVDFIKDFHALHIWQKDFDYTQYKNRTALVAALENTKPDINGNNKYQMGIDILKRNPPTHILKHEDTTYRDSPASRLCLVPVTAAGLESPLWDGRTKLILMSATINSKDIEEMGLANRRVCYIDSDSCIPAEQRKVIFKPSGWIKASTLADTSEKTADKINEIADLYPNNKGLVHATYSQAMYLNAFLRKDPRFMFHDRENKFKVYQEFRNTKQNKILVASGMYEGVDLPYEAGRFQIIAKVPFSNLGEPAIRYQMSEDKEWFQWQAIKQILQACGRICRTPTDHGDTYLLDANFRNLYTNNKDMFPDYFKESVNGLP